MAVQGLCKEKEKSQRAQQNCSCPKTECENNGICCQCVEAHKKKGKSLPHCLKFFIDKKPDS